MSVGSLNLGYTLFNKAALKSFASSILQEKSNLKILIFWCTVKAEVKGGRGLDYRGTDTALSSGKTWLLYPT